MTKTILSDVIVGLLIYFIYKSLLGLDGFNPFVSSVILIVLGVILIPLLIFNIRQIVRAVGLKMKVIQMALLVLAVLLPIMLINYQANYTDSIPRRYYMKSE